MLFYYSFAHPDLTANLIDKKYLPEHLFDWAKPDSKTRNTNEKITEILRTYLSKENESDWIKNAVFILDYDDNEIEIQDDNNNYAAINISLSTKNISLRYKVRIYTNLFKMNFHGKTVSISGKGGTAKEYLDPGFLFKCQNELLSLLFSFQSRSVRNKKLKNILSKDPKYRKTIDEMIAMIKMKD